jgi:hypothetical protein
MTLVCNPRGCIDSDFRILDIIPGRRGPDCNDSPDRVVHRRSDRRVVSGGRNNEFAGRLAIPDD